ncbi:MAG: gamma-glutamyl-gamma-aminobutyrate hydrolase family protein [Alphaproteobacteria bacterium]|nr:gamma-glutamyl-gamma-aminobutyrate hydrolase family protein [Alphaproteobacteria bacterium]
MKTNIVPLIGVTACRKQPGDHPLHSVSEKYITCVSDAAGGLPVLIPALAGRLDLPTLVERLDGLMLTGSPSNVEPHHYGRPDLDAGDDCDAGRDSTTLPLIRAAIAAGVPVFGICRGIQELNVALGGSLHQKIQEIPGKFDHRMRRDVDFDAKYRPAHPIAITPGGVLHGLLGVESALVNSLHAQGIDRLAPGLTVEAVAPDGIVESVSVTEAKAFALAVQWHPEWPNLEEPVSKALFAGFGAACRARAAARLAAQVAA